MSACTMNRNLSQRNETSYSILDVHLTIAYVTFIATLAIPKRFYLPVGELLRNKELMASV